MGLDLSTLALAKIYTDSKPAATNEQVYAAVNQYLKNNPIVPGASPEESAQIETNKQNIINIQKEIVLRSPGVIAESRGTGSMTVNDSSQAPIIGLEIKGNCEQVVTSGAQMLDLRTGNSGSSQGVIYTNNGDGTYKRTGTALSSAGTNWFLGGYNLIPADDGNNVIVTLEANQKYTVKDCMLYTSVDGVSKAYEGTFTPQTEVKITGVRGPMQVADTSYDDTITPMVNKGDAMSWEPYTGGQPSPSPEYPQEIVSTDVTAVRVTGISQSKTATLAIAEPLRGIGDVMDEITMTKRIDRCIELSFDGSENWRLYTTKGYQGFEVTNALPATMTRRMGYCNQLKVSTDGNETKKDGIWLGWNNKYITCFKSSFYDDTADDKGLSAWKAHLSSHPLKVITYLDTPIETDLDAKTIADLAQLSTFTGQTTVLVESDTVKPDISIKYVADTKSYISSEIAKIQSSFNAQIAKILSLLPAQT